MHKSPISETELWAAVRNNEIAAFNKLFELYWVRLYKSAYRYLKDQETSKEIVHDVFLSIWTRRHQLEINSFNEYLLTAVRYQIYNRTRVLKHPVIYVDDYDLTDCGVSSNNGQRKIEETESMDELLDHLTGVPKRCKEIFQLSRVEHLTNDEIADKLAISKRTVENQITIALKHLRLIMKSAVLIVFALNVFK